MCTDIVTSLTVELTGKDEVMDGARGMTHAVVLKLVEGLEQKGHHLYVDNWYTSPALFLDLGARGSGACGTVRINRKGLPDEITSGKMKKGDVTAVKMTGGMMALKWRDKRQVTMLSTLHNDSMVSKRRKSRHGPGGMEDISKPKMVEEYNQYMGGVDKCDQLLSYYGYSHRALKWWRRAFFHLFDLAIVNAYILYTQSTQVKKLNHEHFRVELAKELLLKAGTADPPVPLRAPVCTALPPQSRLTERHFLGRVPPCTTGRQSQPLCVVGSGKKGRGKKTTTYLCKQCNQPMCIIPCFELYHTKVDYVRHLDSRYSEPV